MTAAAGQPSHSPNRSTIRAFVFVTSLSLLVLAYFWAADQPTANSVQLQGRSEFGPGAPSWNDLLSLSRSFPITYTKSHTIPSKNNDSTSHSPLRSPSKSVVFPDVTAIVLNWARLENVKLIVSLLCDPWLSDTIAEVIVWNNNPISLSHTTFREGRCAPGKLRVHNSPDNVFFQARFIACSEAKTPLCFLQDDDYVILPEIIQTLRTRALEKADSAIYLLPPHEYLSNWLKTVVSEKVHTSFAWLGHGTMMHKPLATKFLSTMHSLKPTDEVMKMADNYFSILNNVVAETWFDHGIELGGGKPFTSGQEGEDRNRRHIANACAYLDTLLDIEVEESQPVIWTSITDGLLKTPCLWSSCLLETNIQLFPPRLNRDAMHAKDMLLQEELLLENLTSYYTSYFYNHPLSYVVDGRPETSFCSLQNGKAGDFMQLDLLTSTTWPQGALDLVWLTPSTGSFVFNFSMFDVSADGHEWVSVHSSIDCEEVPLELLSMKEPVGLTECSSTLRVEGRPIRFVRTTLGRNLDFPWCVHELWLRDTKSHSI